MESWLNPPKSPSSSGTCPYEEKGEKRGNSRRRLESVNTPKSFGSSAAIADFLNPLFTRRSRGRDVEENQWTKGENKSFQERERESNEGKKKGKLGHFFAL